MIDIRFVRENPQSFVEKLKLKGINIDVEKFLELDRIKRETQTILDKKKQEKNRISKDVGEYKRKGVDITSIMDGISLLTKEIKETEDVLRETEDSFFEMLHSIANLPHDSVPHGKNENDNVVVQLPRTALKETNPSLDHVSICEKLNLVDFKRGVGVSGSGFPVYRSKGALLERALINFMLDTHTSIHKYEEIMPPFLVKSSSAFGTGQIPKSHDQMYYIPEDDLYAIPTAEVPVTNLYAETIFEPNQLPMKFVAYSPCFRREAGSWGKDTRGLLRLHQFNKVELVKYVLPENSYAELESLRKEAETILDMLKLPYRVIELCTGDLSFAAAKCYDIELWAPGAGKFLEVSSCSNFEDFQARRINLRYRKNDGKLEFIHTLNGSGVATARLMAAIIENYYDTQTNSLIIPDVLVNYMKIDKITA